MFEVQISAGPIEPGRLQEALPRHPDRAGAAVSFTGYVRGEGIEALALEHYPGMTERSIRATIEAAARRWPLLAASVVHRVGELAPGDPIVWVGTVSRHRAAAFAACEFVMDYLKVSAPLWKRERRGGQWQWVAARESDAQRARRWHGAAAAAGA